MFWNRRAKQKIAASAMSEGGRDSVPPHPCSQLPENRFRDAHAHVRDDVERRGGPRKPRSVDGYQIFESLPVQPDRSATSPSSNPWLWSWDNDSLPECVKSRIREVRAFGVKNGVPELTEAALPDDEYLGWAIPVDLFSFLVEVITSQPRGTLAAR